MTVASTGFAPIYTVNGTDRCTRAISWNGARPLDSAYLCRRSLCHAKSEEKLVEHLQLQRCYQNFVRPHRALKFGKITRTPAMQAGLATKALTFREIFLVAMVAALLEIENPWRSESVEVATRLRIAA